MQGFPRQQHQLPEWWLFIHSPAPIWGEGDHSYRQEVEAEDTSDDIMRENNMTVHTYASAEWGQTWLRRPRSAVRDERRN